jgi:nucleotide-binding universal stress UspA family protein
MHIETKPARGPNAGEPRSTIVVGYDGSNESHAAVAAAATRAKEGGTVVAVYAAEPASDWLDTPWYDSAVRSRQERARRIFGQLSNIDLGNVAVEAELVDGPAHEALAQVAKLRRADEIVVGSRRLSRFRAALGSVSRRLLHIADRPVVVVPRGNAACGFQRPTATSDPVADLP